MYIFLIILVLALIILNLVSPSMVDIPDITKLTPAEGSESEDSIILEGSEATEQFRFIKQCYLLDQIEALIAHRTNLPNPNYKYFSCLTGPTAEVTSRLLGKKHVRALFDIKEHQLAFLEPRIRLFKVYEDEAGKVTEDEFHFAAAYGKNFWKRKTGKEDILMDRVSAGDGAGLESFTYTLAGTNPAESKNIIKASIKLKFKSFADLFATRKARSGRNIRFSDLINYTSQDSPVIGKNEGKKASHDKYDPKKFRLKAIVGWGDPEIAVDRKKIFPDPLLQAIRHSRNVLFLQLTAHDVTFNVDGTVSLTVEYIAALETAFSAPSMNIFWIPQDIRLQKLRADLEREQEKRKGALDEVAKYQANKAAILGTGAIEVPSGTDHTTADIKSRREWVDRKTAQLQRRAKEDLAAKAALTLAIGPQLADLAFWGGAHLADAVSPGVADHYLVGTTREAAYQIAVTHWKEEVKENDRLVEEAQSSIDQLKQLRRIARYRRVLNELYESNLVYRIDVPAADLGVFQEGQIYRTDKSLEQREKQRTGEPTIKKAEGKDSASKKEFDKGLELSKQKTVDQDKDAFSNIKPLKKSIDPEDAGTVGISYFYLGDLIDVLIGILRTPIQYNEGEKTGKPESNEEAIKTLDKFTILMGPMVLEIKKKNTVHKRLAVNLADIPISVDYFIAWFQENVIKQQKETYLLKDILMDIMSQLVTSALGEGCFENIKQDLLVTMMPVSVPNIEKGAARIPQAGARCTMAGLRESVKLKPERSAKPIQNMSHILYFYAKEKSPDYLTGNEKTDFDLGIYHVKVGADRGLLKSVNFSRVDFPGRREALITGDAKLVHQDGYLREKYDAELTFVGNDLFFPGQFLYINPTMPGAPKAVTEIMGFGGYFFVQEAYHTIEPQYNQTEVKAIWQSFAKSAGESVNRPTLHPRPNAKPGLYKCQGKMIEEINDAHEVNEGDNPKETAGYGVADVALVAAGVHGLRALGVVDHGTLVGVADAIGAEQTSKLLQETKPEEGE